MIKVDGAQLLVQGLAVPYGRAALIAERGLDGGLQLFRELFDRASFHELPDRVPFTKRHDEDSPLGWARVRSTPAGLAFEAQLIDSSMATDAVSAMRAQLIKGVSIAFAENPDQDQWQRGSKGQPPMVLRRGTQLRHIALTATPAYPSAQVDSVGSESWSHRDSEQIMGQYRAERARAAAKSRAESARLLAETSRVCADPGWATTGLSEPRAGEQAGGAPTMPGAILPSTVVTMGHTRITIAADEWSAPHLAERYREAVMSALRAKGQSLSRTEMDEIRSEFNVLA